MVKARKKRRRSPRWPGQRLRQKGVRAFRRAPGGTVDVDDDGFGPTPEHGPAGYDEKPEVLPPNSVKDVAVYTGWYNVSHYVPSCAFSRGAATHLR